MRHLALAEQLLRDVAPENTSDKHKEPMVAWKGDGAPPCSHADCSGFVDACLSRAYPQVDAEFFRKWLGKKRPLARDDYDAIVQRKYFQPIDHIIAAQRRPSDSMKSSKHLLIFTAALFGTACEPSAARLDILEIPGVTLRDNPLGDREARRVAIFVPEGAKVRTPLPLVIYLPGWGSSSESVMAQGGDGWPNRVVDQLAAAGQPVRLAVVDGRSRYGGSQFLNSTATGNYADYVADEILSEIEARYAVPKSGPAPRIVAGHSSGAYGAFTLASARPEKFAAVVALSPDSDFETTHKSLVEQPAVRAVTRADLDAAMAPRSSARLPADGLARLVMGLCANYAPIAGQPGRFEWLYDDRGQWRPEAWQRWLDLDPLTLVRKKPNAFAPTQRIYLDGAEHDEFGANIGARKIHEVLRSRPAPVTFYESPGHHSDKLPERLARGLAWVFGQSAPDLAPAK